MNQALLIHGMPDKDEYYDPAHPAPSDHHWFPWLAKQLQINDIFARCIEMPAPYMPRYDAWKKEFERYEVTPETLLVGHSCGGGFLTRWLSENPATAAKCVLVAPWINPPGIEDIVADVDDFFDFKIDAKLAERTPTTIFASDNDMESVRVSQEMIRDQLPAASYVEFKEHGHFCLSDLGGPEFAALLAECLSE